MTVARDTLFEPSATPPGFEHFYPALRGPGFDAVVAARLDQLRLGHSLARDRQLGDTALANRAIDYAQMARDMLHPGGRRDLPRARRLLAKTAALCIAALDALPEVDPDIFDGEE